MEYDIWGYDKEEHKITFKNRIYDCNNPEHMKRLVDKINQYQVIYEDLNKRLDSLTVEKSRLYLENELIKRI